MFPSAYIVIDGRPNSAITIISPVSGRVILLIALFVPENDSNFRQRGALADSGNGRTTAVPVLRLLMTVHQQQWGI